MWIYDRRGPDRVSPTYPFLPKMSTQMNDTIRLTDGQRETLTQAAENRQGRVVTRGRRSPHHQRLVDRGLLKQTGTTSIPVREYRMHHWDAPPTEVTRHYRSVVWAITTDGRRAINREGA